MKYIKGKYRRKMAIFMIFVMLVSILPTGLLKSGVAHATSPFVFDIPTKTITGYTSLGLGGAVVIPKLIDGHEVHHIAINAFRDKALSSVTFEEPSNLKTIGPHSFTSTVGNANPNTLTSVIIPAGVTSIENGAFNKNNLSSVSLPNSLINIGDFAFMDNNLTSLTVPNNVTSIGMSAFMNNSLTNLVLPNTALTVDAAAFNLNNLTSVTIPSNVVSLGGSVLLENPNLTSVIIEGSSLIIGDGLIANSGVHMNSLKEQYSLGGPGTYTGTAFGAWTKTITNADNLAEAKSSIETALTNLAVTNATTEIDIVNTANSATSHPITVAWVDSHNFSKTNATSDATGLITGRLLVSLNGLTTEVELNKTIPILSADIPVVVMTASELTNAITNATSIIQLGADIAGYFIIENKNIILDLRGFDLNNTATAVLDLRGTTSLEIKDTTTLADGEVFTSANAPAINLIDTSTLTVSSGVIRSTLGSATSISTETDSRIIVNGGTLKSDTGIVIRGRTGSVIINGGTIESGTTNSILNTGGNITISGGNFDKGTGIHTVNSFDSVVNTVISGGDLGMVRTKNLKILGNPKLTIHMDSLESHKFSITDNLTGSSGGIILDFTYLSAENKQAGKIIATADNANFIDMSAFSVVGLGGLTIIQDDVNIILEDPTITVVAVTTQEQLLTAIANAPDDGTPTLIELGGNFTVPNLAPTNLISGNKNIILDLKGFTITSNIGALITVRNTAKLEIKDTSVERTGKLITPSGYRIIISYDTSTVKISGGLLRSHFHTITNGGAGEIIIDGGTVETTSSNHIAIHNTGSGTVNILSGTVESTSTTDLLPTNPNLGAAIYNYSDGTVNILGGTIKTKALNVRGIWNFGVGEVNIHDGSIIKAQHPVIVNTKGTINIYGGNIELYRLDNFASGTTLLNENKPENPTINISGGTISSVNGRIDISYGTINVTGGIIGDRIDTSHTNSGHNGILNISGNPTLKVRLYSLINGRLRITGPLTGVNESIELSGVVFNPTPNQVIATAINETDINMDVFKLTDTTNKFIQQSGTNIIINSSPWSHDISAVTDTWDLNGGTIATAQELAQLAYNVNNGKSYSMKQFTLLNDINLSGREWTPIGSRGNGELDPIKPFLGIFNGNGFKITGVQIGTETSPNSTLNSAGLFGYLGAPSYGGRVDNLGVEEVAIYLNRDYASVGGLAGISRSGRIDNCYTTGIIVASGNSSIAGGLVGSIDGAGVSLPNSLTTEYTNKGVILNSYSKTNVTVGNGMGSTNRSLIGGLIGRAQMSIIRNAYATGNVIAGTNSNAAGLIANAASPITEYFTTVENVYSTGNVTSATGSNVFASIGETSQGFVSSHVHWNENAAYTIGGVAQEQNYQGILFTKMTLADMQNPALITSLTSYLNARAKVYLKSWQTGVDGLPVLSNTVWVVPDTTAPVLTAGEVNRTSNSQATVKFTSDEAGTYFFNVGNAVTDTTSNGTANTTTENTITLSNLTAGQTYIYIVVKDAAGNISDNTFRINIPDFVPDEYTLIVSSATGNDDADRADNATYQTIGGAINIAQNGDIIKLEEDINLSTSGIIISNKDIVIDLYGKKLDAVVNTAIFRVKDGATITIIDSSNEKTGEILGSPTSILNENGTINIREGTIRTITSSNISSIINIFGGTINSISSTGSTGVTNIHGGTINSVSTNILNISGSPKVTVLVLDLNHNRLTIVGELTGADGEIILNGAEVIIGESLPAGIVAAATNPLHANLNKFQLNNAPGKYLVKTGSDIVIANTINISEISGVTPPVTGATRVTAIEETAQYTGTVTWSPNHAVFQAGTQYTATITLTPKTGFTLEGVTANFFTVTGTSPAAINNVNSGVITAIFPATGFPAPTVPVITAQPTVQKTFAGGTATFSVTANTNVGALNYQWQTRINDSGTWINVTAETGINGRQYTTPILSAADDNRQYRVVIKSKSGVVFSAEIESAGASVQVSDNVYTISSPLLTIRDQIFDGVNKLRTIPLLATGSIVKMNNNNHDTAVNYSYVVIAGDNVASISGNNLILNMANTNSSDVNIRVRVTATAQTPDGQRTAQTVVDFKAVTLVSLATLTRPNLTIQDRTMAANLETLNITLQASGASVVGATLTGAIQYSYTVEAGAPIAQISNVNQLTITPPAPGTYTFSIKTTATASLIGGGTLTSTRITTFNVTKAAPATIANPTCTIDITSFAGQSLTIPTLANTATTTLAASATISQGTCDVNDIVYTYTIKPGSNTAGASITGDELTATRKGHVTVIVTASITNGNIVTSEAIFTIASEDIDLVEGKIDSLPPANASDQEITEKENDINNANDDFTKLPDNKQEQVEEDKREKLDKLVVRLGRIKSMIESSRAVDAGSNNKLTSVDVMGLATAIKLEDVKAYIDAGKDITVKLEIEDEADSSNKLETDKDKELISQEAVTTGRNVGRAFNINITKIIEEKQGDQVITRDTQIIKETVAPIYITIGIPANMRNGSNYEIIHVHTNADGTKEITTIIPVYKQSDQTLRFTMSRFSTIAIAYTPPVVTTPPSNDNGNSNDDSDSAPAPSAPTTPVPTLVQPTQPGTEQQDEDNYWIETPVKDGEQDLTQVEIDTDKIKEILDKDPDKKDIIITIKPTQNNGTTPEGETVADDETTPDGGTTPGEGTTPGAGTTSEGTVVVIPANVTDQINNRNGTIAIETDDIEWTMTGEQLKKMIDNSRLKDQADSNEIDIVITAKRTDADKTSRIEQLANTNNITIVSSLYDFKVEITAGQNKVTATTLQGFAKIRIPVPEGQENYTTAVRIDENGNMYHVPTNFKTINGRLYAEINSTTAGTYAIVHTPRIFIDVNNHWSEQTVNKLASKLIILGVGDNNFEPERNTSRAEFVTLLLRALGIEGTHDANAAEFSDVTADKWYYEAIQIARTQGFVNGYGNNEFKPQETISRQEAMVMFARAVRFADLAGNSQGMSILNNYIDHSEVAMWAKDDVATVVGLEIFIGFGNGDLKPKENISRAQSAQAISNLLTISQLINR